MIPPMDYKPIAAALKSKAAELWPGLFAADLVPKWTRGYSAMSARHPSIVKVELDGFTYLFDVEAGRLIGVFGLSRGKHTGARDASRMRGHPQSAGAEYHRGHAIAHTLGGGTDMNLFGQRGRLNIGEFRVLEKAAVADANALYFLRLGYALANDGQLPDWIEQGLFPSADPAGLQVRAFRN